ncbi:uncharacterized protein LOC107362137 [Tetranychus urticae]|uniref:uncharacterized protein LOC107362137 n=1 Tax=Tetranychus urticae TaxID=32264 RepID=UPI00077BA5A4|nr:uncharacterized protein LOC107362137 [Tetranychus urticae]
MMDKKLIVLQFYTLVITIFQLSVIQLCSGELLGSIFGSPLVTDLQNDRIDVLNKLLSPKVLPVGGNVVAYELLQTLSTRAIQSGIFDTVGQFGTVVRSFLGPLTLPYSLDFDRAAKTERMYDYVIVGAGSAGSTLAARLTEDEDVTVLVIEAGGEESHFNNVPIFAVLTQRTDIDWGYYSVPQTRSARGLNNKQIPASRGKVVGGSSSINLMIYSRGNPIDYERWQELGATGWNSSAMDPYFVKMENTTDPTSQPGYHGTTGPLTISTVSETFPVDSAFHEGLKQYGLKIGDYNANDQERFQYSPFTIRDGRRCSTGRAYLGPASSRKNLDILLFSRVTKIIFDDDKRAIGVEFTNSEKDYQVFARKKVIISTGGIATPQLLMLSGIGPRDQLEKFNIPIVHESPGVGNNLQDHPFTFFLFTTKADTSILLARDLIPNLAVYSATHKGRFASSGANVVGFYRSKFANDSRPDLQIYEFAYSFGGGAPDFYLGYIFNFDRQTLVNYALPNTFSDGTAYVISLVKPRSTGTIKLASSNIRDPPLIDFNFFTDPRDLDAMAEGCRLVLNISMTPSMQTVEPRRYNSTLPGCEQYPLDSNDYLKCLIQTITYTLWHSVGTASMGLASNPLAVVSPDLHVHGVKDLMVVDTSVMPAITTGNTNTPTIAIAERVADMLKGRVLRAKSLPYTDEYEYINDYVPYQIDD